MASKIFAVVGIVLFVSVCLAMPIVFAESFGSDCVMIRASAYEGGSPVCVRMPSKILRGWNAAEAFKLGYEKQPDGTFKKAID